MKFKRRRNKRQVRCTSCTKYRWMGNSSSKDGGSARRLRDVARKLWDRAEAGDHRAAIFIAKEAA